MAKNSRSSAQKKGSSKADKPVQSDRQTKSGPTPPTNWKKLLDKFRAENPAAFAVSIVLFLIWLGILAYLALG